MIIFWAVGDTKFGPALAAATERGICRVSFDLNPTPLLRDHPGATLEEDPQAPLVRAALAAIDDPALAADVPLDCGGTAFQRRVWNELRRIPPGQTCSYLDIARALGDPKATRAVGGANRANRVAILIPCHRVIGADGGLGGYAWGLERKRALLDAETKAAQGSLPLLS
jgi:AraC family transcriptional regulator of adaptative response/methylated-DNA-[protein]-cysteine methyltransferase